MIDDDVSIGIDLPRQEVGVKQVEFLVAIHCSFFNDMACIEAGLTGSNLCPFRPTLDVVRCRVLVGWTNIEIRQLRNAVVLPAIRSHQCAPYGSKLVRFCLRNWVHGDLEAKIGRNPRARPSDVTAPAIVIVLRVTRLTVEGVDVNAVIDVARSHLCVAGLASGQHRHCVSLVVHPTVAVHFSARVAVEARSVSELRQVNIGRSA